MLLAAGNGKKIKTRISFLEITLYQYLFINISLVGFTCNVSKLPEASREKHFQNALIKFIPFIWNTYFWGKTVQIEAFDNFNNSTTLNKNNFTFFSYDKT
jgi:hypothetical protein